MQEKNAKLIEVLKIKPTAIELNEHGANPCAWQFTEAVQDRTTAFTLWFSILCFSLLTPRY